MDKQTAERQAKLASERAVTLRKDADHIEQMLPKWHFDRAGKDMLARVAKTLRATADAYDDYQKHMETRSELRFAEEDE